MSNRKLYYILKSVWMVVVLIVAFIVMNRDYTDISANKEEETRLNIALVNEDVGVTRNGKVYNLGVDYVKKIEKDTDHQWFTVTRGIGESGLKNGTYNLLITIPSMFSAKLMELDSVSPEKLQINYKINANGNSTLENESRSVGRSIVNGLNQQLVDMYIVSIIDNLYTAQQNIEKVYTNQTELVGNFQDNLYQPTVNFKTYLPALTSQSNSALQSNDLLTSLLGSFSDSTGSLVDSHKDYSTVLEQLLQQRVEGKLTYEEFLEILLSLDSSIISSETSSLISTISCLNDYFAQQFSSQEEGQYFQQMSGLTGDFEQSKQDITKQIEELEGLRDKYFEKYETQFYSSLGYPLKEGEQAPGITLRDVIRKKYEMASTIPDEGMGEAVKEYFDQIEGFNKRYVQKMQDRLDLLPLRDVDNFVGSTSTATAEIFNYLNAPYAYWHPQDGSLKNIADHPLLKIEDYLDGINTKVTAINGEINNQNDVHYAPADWNNPYIGVPQLQFSEDNAEVDTGSNSYYDTLQKAYTNLELERDTAVNTSHEIVLQWKNMEDQAAIYIEPNAAIELSQFPTGADYIGLVTGGTNDNWLEYRVKNATSATIIKIPYDFVTDYDESKETPNIQIKVSQAKITLDSDGEGVSTPLRVTRTAEKTLVVESLTSTSNSENIIESEHTEKDVTETKESSVASEEPLEDDTEYSDLPASAYERERTPILPDEQRSPKAEGEQEGYYVTITYPLDVSAFLNKDYQDAKRVYSEEIGKILELYKTVDKELEEYSDYPFIAFHTFLDIELTDVFKTVLNQSFMNTDGDFDKQWQQLHQLQTLVLSIEDKNAVVHATLAQTQENTSMLNASVTEQIELLNTWQETSQDLTSSESLVSAMNSQMDSEVSAVYETLKTILSQSERVRESSLQNIEQADEVKGVFDSFNKGVENAQQNSEELSANAEQIMEDLTVELADNSNFVDAFMKVLNNAYQDGVPNNSLLQFIANPVTGNAEATIQTTEVNQPFTWILIMFTLSLFLAYLFATQPVIRKIKDKFKREQLWLKDNIVETLLLSVSAMVVGLVLALLSISELAVMKEVQIMWLVMVLMFMLIFSLMNHYAMKQFHIAGFALNLFLFVSYVFITNAIGKTKGNNPLVGFIRRINPLSIGEHNLSAILSNHSLDGSNILLYLLSIVALAIVNIFIWKPGKKAREVVKK